MGVFRHSLVLHGSVSAWDIWPTAQPLKFFATEFATTDDGRGMFKMFHARQVTGHLDRAPSG